MPPLAVDGSKAVAQHRPAQQHAVVVLLLRDGAAVGMGQLAEQVKGAAHIHLLAGFHIQQGQVHRAAAAVAGAGGDIAALEQLLLFQVWVKIRLHAQVQILDPPEHKVPHRAGGAIGVEDFETVALCVHLAADGFECAGGLPRQSSSDKVSWMSFVSTIPG